MASFLKILRKIRILLALIVFVAISAQFLDIYNQLPREYYMFNPVKTQFAPSLLKWLATGSVVSASAFITFSIMALIFGRAYCASFCAFGILMDIIRTTVKKIGNAPIIKKTRLNKSIKKATMMKYRPARNIIRCVFLSIAFLMILCGWTTLFGFLDPYSLYGKIMGSAVHTITAETANNASALLSEFGIYTIEPINGNPRVALASFGIALTILATISIVSIFRGRLFCNSVCPVGAMLGMISKFSIFTLSLDNSKCISCGMCERNCKSECINSQAKKLDFSKCVLCFNCANSCPKNAIKFSLNEKYQRQQSTKPVEKQITKSPSQMSRRTFPRALASLSALMLSAAKKECKVKQSSKSDSEAPSPYQVDGARPDKRLAAPPGAKSIENFLENCTACQICTAACKAQILKPSMNEWGLSHFMQPYMDFNEGFCLHNCHNCSKVCPTGAINFISGKEKRHLKIGTAIFDEDLCIVKTDGTDCAACAEHCPVQAIEMLPFGDKADSLFIPYVHSEVCIGCGACESICPVRPHRAIVVQGIAVHRQAKKFEESMRIHKTTQKTPKSDKIAPQENPFPF